MIQLFDYIKIVFSSDEKQWNKLTSQDKSRNFFMCSRFMSIKYPVQANMLSHYKIDPESVADYWHRSMSSLFKSVPGWVYAKTVKKTESAKKNEYPSPEMVRWYCEKNEMSRRDFDDNAKFFGEVFLAEIRSLEKVLRSQDYF